VTVRASAALVAVVAVGLILIGPLSRSLPPREGGVLPVLHVAAGCEVAPDDGAWQPEYTGYDEAHIDDWLCGDARVVTHAAIWRTQAEGREAVSESNRLLPTSWRFATTTAERVGPAGLEVTEHVVAFEDRPWVVWSWYSVGTTPAATDLATKVREALNAVRLEHAPVARFAVGVEADSVDAARGILSEHAARVWQGFVAAQAAPPSPVGATSRSRMAERPIAGAATSADMREPPVGATSRSRMAERPIAASAGSRAGARSYRVEMPESAVGATSRSRMADGPITRLATPA